MRIAIAQISPVVGAFDQNVKAIQKAFLKATAEGASLTLTPELGICGYPPHDLMDRVEIFERNERALETLRAFTEGKKGALLVGHVARNTTEKGRFARNAITILEDGQVVFQHFKMLLPTYDVFDEARYFEPGDQVGVWNCDGKKVGIAICEDLWGEDPKMGRRLYGKNPVEEFKKQGVDLIVSSSASPFELKKREHREWLHAEVCRKVGVPLVYVNQVGATDEILFDGMSFAMNSKGEVIKRLPGFSEALELVDPDNLAVGELETPDEEATLCLALETGIREYFQRSGFSKAIIGLSGGIDSAVVAALAVRALGKENVLGVSMPSQYSSGHSLEDAEKLAQNLGIEFQVQPIKFYFSVFSRELRDGREELGELPRENLQARLRGIILMSLSNHRSSLVLTTGNKSELAVGYCTLYGDMVGALDPIGDLYKTQVYSLAKYLNRTGGGAIPDRILTKAPSAELRPNQFDQDSLPPYEQLDPALEDYIQNGVSVSELEKTYGSWIREIARKVELSEYKRRQAAPVLKVTNKAFGIGRRIPVAKTWDKS